MSWKVRTEVFEGPLDLLLHLIMQEQVDLWEVSLSRIVDAYVAEVEQIASTDLEVATEFLLIAAVLIELKVKRLLPAGRDAILDDELEFFTDRDLLLARLLECKTYSDVAERLRHLLELGSKRVSRTAGPEEPFASLAPDPLGFVSPKQLARAAARGLSPKPAFEFTLSHVTPIRATIKEALERVLELTTVGETTTFEYLTDGLADKIELVVHFLAVLELYKQGVLDIDQIESFGSLTIRRVEETALLSPLAEWDEEWNETAAREIEAAQIDLTIAESRGASHSENMIDLTNDANRLADEPVRSAANGGSEGKGPIGDGTIAPGS